jgi:Flp pilus assembly protein TadG
VSRLFRASARHRHPERGATAVEFAWVLPFLVATTLGTIDLGRMVVAKEMCAYAAIVGARTALGRYESDNSTALTSADVQTAAIRAVPMLKLPSTAVTVTATDPSNNVEAFTARGRGHTVTVKVTYTYTPLIPGISKIVAGGKNWAIKSSMVIP